jgi:SAM-dependent methyltransferase
VTQTLMDTLWTEFRAWFRRSIGERGVVGALGHCTVRGLELVRDYGPARRRLRYGDLEYDWQFGVDTTWSNVPLRTRLREIFTEGQYQPVDPAAFHESLSTLVVDYGEFTFIDLGSGKGRALLLASDYPFRRIVGVEVIPELHAIAVQNIRKYSSPSQQCQNINSVNADAREFAYPPEPTVLYVFNSFPERVLEKVLQKFQRSLLEHPRKAVIIYHSPELEHVLTGLQGFRKLSGDLRYAVYVTCNEGSPRSV